jgi:putative ABC transport system permease protein
MALGANRADILKMVVRNGLGITVIGMGVGFLGVFGLTRSVASLLFGVVPTDVLTVVSASGVLMGAALIACYVPARRATKVDPLVALRYE